VGLQDTELYERLLGLVAPWSVAEVTLDIAQRLVSVRLECDKAQVWACPQCQHRAHIHDWTERLWRHLDSCQMRTVIRAKVPRVRCSNPDCALGGTDTVQVPWSEGSSRFTLLFESLAIRLLQECSLSAAADLLRVSWDEIDGIMTRAVARGLVRKAVQPELLKQVCVDEKSAGRGQEYVTVVAAIRVGEPATVEYLSDGREEASLDAYWLSRTPDQLAALEGVGMDMWRPYWNSTVTHLAQGAEVITYDRFHIMQHVGVALNEVRRSEQAGGATELKGTRMDWLRSQENLTPAAQARVQSLCTPRCKTGRAYAMKEALREFWACGDAAEGAAFLRWWTGWAQRCRLPPMAKIGGLIKRHSAGLLTWFNTRLSNGPIEGLNNKIQGLVKRSFGFRNRERLKTAIYFHCGGLSLLPED
jgi:transposase